MTVDSPIPNWDEIISGLVAKLSAHQLLLSHLVMLLARNEPDPKRTLEAISENINALLDPIEMPDDVEPPHLAAQARQEVSDVMVKAFRLLGL